jgi:hypothetical protein
MGARPTVGHGIDIRRAAGPANQTRRECAEHVPEQEGSCIEPLYRGGKGSLAIVPCATHSRVNDAFRVIAPL